MHTMMHDTGAGHWFGHPLMLILMVAFLALIFAWAHLLAIALKAWRKRCASGHIDREAYLRRHQYRADSKSGANYGSHWLQEGTS
jgi:hypothetical protein